MTLYSWFLRKDKKPEITSVHVKNNSIKTSNANKYLENYTMWPTAKIKPDVEIFIPSNYGKMNSKPLEHQKETLVTGTALTIIKAK